MSIGCNDLTNFRQQAQKFRTDLACSSREKNVSFHLPTYSGKSIPGHLRQPRTLRVLFRNNGVGDAPRNVEIRIVPENPVFIAGVIEITTFVEELDGIGQSQESMCKSRWNIDLILFLCGESNTGPFSELRRTDPDVDRDVQSFSFHDPAQLGLWMSQLIVESAQCSAGGTRMIVLNEAICDAKLLEFCLVVSFEEKTAFIAKHPWP